MDILNPFTEEQFRSMKDSLAQLEMARLALLKAKSAGVDVGDAMKQRDDAEAKLKGILQVYFPGR